MQLESSIKSTEGGLMREHTKSRGKKSGSGAVDMALRNYDPLGLGPPCLLLCFSTPAQLGTFRAHRSAGINLDWMEG